MRQMAKHQLRLKSDASLMTDIGEVICPHNTIFNYSKDFEYFRVLKDGSHDTSIYQIPFELSTNEDLFEEL